MLHLVGWPLTLLVLILLVLGSALTLGRLPLYASGWVRRWARALIWVGGYRLEEIGLDALAGSAPRIVTINHASTLDFMLVCALYPPRSVGVVKRELANIPIVGTAARVVGTLVVDRGDHQAAIAGIAALGHRIAAERLSVFIAPEGTRSLDGRLGPFKMGPFHLAMHSGAPVFPVVVEGAHTLWPKGRLWGTPGTVRLRLLAPVATDAWRPETLSEARDDLRARYLQALGQVSADNPASPPS